MKAPTTALHVDENLLGTTIGLQILYVTASGDVIIVGDGSLLVYNGHLIQRENILPSMLLPKSIVNLALWL